MITHVTEKSTAYCQRLIFQQTRNIAKISPCIARATAFFASIADITFETGKYSVIALENLFVGIINTSGSPFFDGCSSQDAQENLLEIKANMVQSIAMGILAPLNLLGRLYINLPAPQNAHSYNKQIEEQINLPTIAYDLQERKFLYESINAHAPSDVTNALSSSVLTSFSLNEALLKAIDNKSNNSIMKMLLHDERTTKSGIDKALIHEINGTSKILLSNFPKIYQPILNIETCIKKIEDKTLKPINQLPDISELSCETTEDINTTTSQKIYENLEQAVNEANTQGFSNFAKYVEQKFKRELNNRS